MRGTLRNLRVPWLGSVFEVLIFGLMARQHGPSDRLGAELARGVLEDGALRRHLTADIYVPSAPEEGLGELEATLKKVVAARPVVAKLRQHVSNGLKNGSLDRAVEAGIITGEELQCLIEADAARDATIQVDFFEPDAYHGLKG